MNNALEPGRTPTTAAPTRMAWFRSTPGGAPPGGGARRARLGAAGTALALGLTLLPLQAPAAMAFDRGSCQAAIGSANIKSANQFYVDHPNVRFDDISSGSNGKAVICFSKDHFAAEVVGDLTGRNFDGRVQALVAFYDEDDVLLSSSSALIGVKNGTSETHLVDVPFRSHTQHVHRVRIGFSIRLRLSDGHLGPWSEVARKNAFWG